MVNADIALTDWHSNSVDGQSRYCEWERGFCAVTNANVIELIHCGDPLIECFINQFAGVHFAEVAATRSITNNSALSWSGGTQASRKSLVA